YSDLAIGCAHLLGYRLAQNFNMPYLSANIAEFWRRWHISLSSWLRDYLFIPLGGSRGRTWATCRNLFLTMALGGLWHGASWTFVLWGCLHGMLLIVHRSFRTYCSTPPCCWRRTRARRSSTSSSNPDAASPCRAAPAPEVESLSPVAGGPRSACCCSPGWRRRSA